MNDGQWRLRARSIEARVEVVDDYARATDREFRWGMAFVFFVIALSWWGFARCFDRLEQRVEEMEVRERKEEG